MIRNRLVLLGTCRVVFCPGIIRECVFVTIADDPEQTVKQTMIMTVPKPTFGRSPERGTENTWEGAGARGAREGAEVKL